MGMSAMSLLQWHNESTGFGYSGGVTYVHCLSERTMSIPAVFSKALLDRVVASRILRCTEGCHN